MKREFLQNLKVGDQALPKEVIDAIMAENGRDIEDAKKPFADYETIKTQLGEAAVIGSASNTLPPCFFAVCTVAYLFHRNGSIYTKQKLSQE